MPLAECVGSTSLLLFGALVLVWLLPPVLRGTFALRGNGFLLLIGAVCTGGGGYQLFQLARHP